MTRTATRLLIAIALGAAAAGAANAQANTGGAAPAVGTSGDATKVVAGNRENNAAYNSLIGATDTKSSKSQDRPAKHSAAVAATAADIKAGSPLRDVKGVSIGTVASVEADGAVVDTGQTKIKVPLMAFGKDDQGLLLAITAAKFNELIAQAHATH
jgi:hypothetical protein